MYAYPPITDQSTARTMSRVKGNRDSYTVAAGTPTTYTPNNLNQYTATADPIEAFTHDDDGNP